MKKAFKAILIAVLAGFLFGFMLLLFFPQQICEYALRKAGLEKAAVGAARIGFDGLELRDLDLGMGARIAVVRASSPGDIFISGPIVIDSPLGPVTVDTEGRLTARTDGAYLWNAPFTATAKGLETEGILTLTRHPGTGRTQAQADISKANIATAKAAFKRIAGWVTLDYTPGQMPLAGAQLAAGAARAYGVALEGATASLSATPDRIQLLVSAAAQDGKGNVLLDLSADTPQAAAGKGALDLQIDLRDLKAAAKAGIAWSPETHTLALKTTQARFSGHGVTVANAALDLRARLGDAPGVDGTVTAGNIQSPWLLPVNLALAFRQDGAATRISGDVTEPNGRFTARLRGVYDFAKNRLDLTAVMPPVTFQAGVTEVAEVFPAARGYVDDAAGTLGATVRAAYAGGAFSASAQVLARDVGGSVKGNAFRGVNAVLELDGLSPPVFRDQTVAVGMLDAGLPLTGGVMRASLDEKRNLSFHRMDWTLAGGTLSAAPFTLGLDDMNADVTLTAKGVNLVEMFRLAPLEGLDATGTVGGVLPLEIRGGKVAIVNGVLETEEGGAIRYNPREVPAFLQDTSRQQIADLRVALEAFDYESLKLVLNGQAGGEQAISLHAKGQNPGFYGGHPVKINFHVEGPLQSVIKYSLGNNRIPESVRKQIEAYEEQHAAK